MLTPEILFAGLVNGLMAGGIYVLVAVGLTLIYGVLHIVNFAHGSLLMPTFYVSPSSGNAFVLIAFTIVALGGMGSFKGAFLGGLIVGIVESICGLWLGEQL